jgi:hypothetical protein
MGSIIEIYSYTVLDSVTTVTSTSSVSSTYFSASPTSSTSSTPSPTATSTVTKTIAIAVGVGAGVALLVIGMVSLFLCRRRRNEKTSEPQMSSPYSPGASSAGLGTQQRLVTPSHLALPTTRLQAPPRSRDSYGTASNISSSTGGTNYNSLPPRPLSHMELPTRASELSRFSHASSSNLSTRSTGVHNLVPPSPFDGAPDSRIASPVASSVREKQALAFDLYSRPAAAQQHPRAPYQGSEQGSSSASGSRGPYTATQNASDFHPSQLLPRKPDHAPPAYS